MARSKNTQHHRRPRSTGGDSNPENISFVTEKEHRAYHLLFANKEPRVIARILTKRWIDPEWRLVAYKKKTEGEKKSRKTS